MDTSPHGSMDPEVDLNNFHVRITPGQGEQQFRSY